MQDAQGEAVIECDQEAAQDRQYGLGTGVGIHTACRNLADEKLDRTESLRMISSLVGIISIAGRCMLISWLPQWASNMKRRARNGELATQESHRASLPRPLPTTILA